MSKTTRKTQLDLLPLSEYKGVDEKDPIRFYKLPILGHLYQSRIELCLNELSGGQNILEIGFGSGVTFLNLFKLYENIYGLDLTADVNLISEFFKTKNIDTVLQNGNVLSLPYPDKFFDSILLISILEHLHPSELDLAFQEIHRVLKPGGQVVYGVPVERPFMVIMFKLLGTNIRTHHFSTETDVYNASIKQLYRVRIKKMYGPLQLFGQLYEVGHFQKEYHKTDF